MTDEPLTALSTSELAHATGIGHMQIHRWVRAHAITPSISDTRGTGDHRQWSHHDRARLQAIATVLDDLTALGVAYASTPLVRRLWDDLHRTPTATVRQGTVTITVGLGLEDG